MKGDLHRQLPGAECNVVRAVGDRKLVGPQSDPLVRAKRVERVF
jgi:hypothetical protein